MAITRRDFLKYTAVVGGSLMLGVFDLEPVKAYAEANPPVWTTEAKNICPYCGVGCGLVLGSNGTGQITYVQGDPDSPINQGSLCPKGHDCGEMNHIAGWTRPVGIPYLASDGLPYKAADSQRITRPLVRRPGASNWDPITWDAALNEIAGLIKTRRDADLIATGSGWRLESVAALGSAKVNNEECYLFAKLMRALGMVYVDHCART
ncbi:MAG: twin-arginine translocation signal domain-containing protein [Nitrospirota bacterium]